MTRRSPEPARSIAVTPPPRNPSTRGTVASSRRTQRSFGRDADATITAGPPMKRALLPVVVSALAVGTCIALALRSTEPEGERGSPSRTDPGAPESGDAERGDVRIAVMNEW